MKTETIFTTKQYRLDKVTMQVNEEEVKWYHTYQRQQLGENMGEWAHIGRLGTENLARVFVAGVTGKKSTPPKKQHDNSVGGE